jgi:hypothetical protein
LDANDVSLEHLDALFARFNNSHVHLYFVTWKKSRNVIALVLVVNDVCGLHGGSLGD